MAKVPTIEFDLVIIPAGEFTLSEDAGGDTVDLSEYHISRHRVSSGQYRAFVAATGQGRMPSHASDSVVAATWEEADAFCEWASKEIGRTVRLPTEAEWEKAMAELVSRQASNDGFVGRVSYPPWAGG